MQRGKGDLIPPHRAEAALCGHLRGEIRVWHHANTDSPVFITDGNAPHSSEMSVYSTLNPESDQLNR